MELKAAKSIAELAGVVEHRFVRLPDLREASDIPGFRLGGRPPTYIPLKNSIFYSFAAAYAEETGSVTIVGGHNRDDLDVFDDVSSEFFGALQSAILTASPLLRARGVRIERPLSDKRKPMVVKLASSIGVPLELTWSCYRAGPSHCWKCRGCESRIRAFEKAGVSDPLVSSRGRKLLKQ